MKATPRLIVTVSALAASTAMRALQATGASPLRGGGAPAAFSPQTNLSDLPRYQPRHQVSGTIRTWGHGFLKEAMANWEAGFRAYHPNARFEDQLYSSAGALAGLYAGRADIGGLVREIEPAEAAAYRKFAGQKPFAVDVLTGSLGDPDKLMALAVFVPKDCPIDHLSFAQLDGIFGAEHLRSGRNLRTWGDLGLVGAWQDRPIHPYAGPVAEAPAFLFSQTVMKGSGLWNDALRQYDDVDLPNGKTLNGYRRVIEAAGADPDGIALTGAGYRNPNLKPVAIGIDSDGPYVSPTAEHVWDRTYPLSRPVYVYLNGGPALQPDPDAVEFLRYVVSREGQDAAAKEGIFMPLNAAASRASLAKLDRLEAGMSDVPDAAGLRLVAKIAVPEVSGTWDHLTADAETRRLFLSAQDVQAVAVFDLDSNRPSRLLKGLFDRPQGECYLPGLDKLVVTNGHDGTCKLLGGESFALEHSFRLSMGADMIAYDPRTKLLYVESGGTDSGRGPGKLTVIDPVSGTALGEIVTGFRAAALALEQGSDRLYAALPGANRIAVIDRAARKIETCFDLPGRPASMALDELDHRLLVATRTWKDSEAKPRFYALDTRTGRIVADLESTDGTENMWYDALHRRIYTSSLEGPVLVYGQTADDRYSVLGRIAAPPHAGTSQFIPELGLLCIAVSAHGGHAPAVWVFRTVP